MRLPRCSLALIVASAGTAAAWQMPRRRLSVLGRPALYKATHPALSTQPSWLVPAKPARAAPLRAVSIDEEAPTMARVAPLLGFLGLWYAFNAAFNVQNKVILNKFPYPWAASWFQLASGILFFVPAWLTKLRSPPNVDTKLILRFLPIAALHCGGHGLQVSSMGAGSVFFTHVIKATEPVVGMLVLLAFTGKIAPWWVNACLAPIVGGVVYAGIKPGTAFGMGDLLGYASVAALASTVAFSIAKLLAKSLMTKETKQKHNLTPANNYAVLTVCSTLVLLLPSALGEGPAALAAIKAMPNPAAFMRQLVGCGFLYYGYNEMGFRVLDLLSPVSAAVANSLKRVAVLLAAVVFLGEKVSSRKIIGSSVAMAGVLLYSLAKTKAAKLPPKPVKIVVDAEEPGTWQP